MTNKISKEEYNNSNLFLSNVFQREKLVRNSINDVVLYFVERQQVGIKHFYSIFIFDREQPINISRDVGNILGYKWHSDGKFHVQPAVEVESGGEDTCAVLTIELSQALYGDGYKLDHRKM